MGTVEILAKAVSRLSFGRSYVSSTGRLQRRRRTDPRERERESRGARFSFGRDVIDIVASQHDDMFHADTSQGMLRMRLESRSGAVARL